MEKEVNQNWYILFVRGGREKKIIDSINNLLRKLKLEQSVNEIKILEGISDSGRNKNLLPGYIFVNCEMTTELLNALYSVSDVISFLNHSKSDLTIMPNHLSILEANNFNFLFSEKKKEGIKKANKVEISKPSSLLKKSIFNIGDLILIKEGFFKDHRGSIIKVDDRKNLVTINIDFFGRSTPISVNFTECEKIV
ncbi:MAG: Transcription termination/antitermination protein NusG [Mycoplasmataceae bacterium]|nr:MAG: Transcription termination/antitermination protein NusG [Mycoplasmataceae bacterium]